MQFVAGRTNLLDKPKRIQHVCRCCWSSTPIPHNIKHTYSTTPKICGFILYTHRGLWGIFHVFVGWVWLYNIVLIVGWCWLVISHHTPRANPIQSPFLNVQSEFWWWDALWSSLILAMARRYYLCPDQLRRTVTHTVTIVAWDCTTRLEGS